jgi:hypothetical protein
MVTINAAESNRTSIRAIPEATWSTLPASGLTREIRITSSSLVASKETAISDEIRADRMISSIIETGASSGGDINFEFSAGSHDDFLQAFVLGAWTRPMTFDAFEGTTVSWGTTSRLDISGGDFTDYFIAGRRLKTEGFIELANNDYWEIASAAFVSGVTQVTMTTATAVVESGNALGRVIDANDVVILKNTDIRFGTVANQIDSNGNNAFAAAILAEQLVVGQRIFVDGLGYEAGAITFTGVGVDGDTVIFSDGVETTTFEFDDDNTVTAGNIAVAVGTSATEAADNLADAMMLNIGSGCAPRFCADNTAGVLDYTNLRGTGGTVTENLTNATITTALTGGDTTLHGVFTLTAVSDDVLTVEETVGTDANAGGAAVTIKGSHLRNPGDLADITRQSFTIETGFNDVGKYFIQKGMRVGTFSMSVASGEIVTGTYSFQGKDTTTSETSVLGSAPYDVLASTPTEVFNATANVGTIEKDGVTLTTAIQSIEISGEAGLREQRAVSEKFPAGIGYGRFVLTGSLTAYFETFDFYNDFINHKTVSIGWNFTDVDNSQYYFTVPAIKITSDPIAPGGIDQDILEEMEWSAQRDPQLNTMFMVDRFSSTLPTCA